jgi:hypothetical protein
VSVGPLRSAAATTVLVTAGLGALASPAWAASTNTLTFVYTGAGQQWVVPQGVSSLTLDAFGAQGGSAGATTASSPGGEGARAHGTVPVTPGETLLVLVGGAGAGPSAMPLASTVAEEVYSQEVLASSAAEEAARPTCASGPTTDWPNA